MDTGNPGAGFSGVELWIRATIAGVEPGPATVCADMNCRAAATARHGVTGDYEAALSRDEGPGDNLVVKTMYGLNDSGF